MMKHNERSRRVIQYVDANWCSGFLLKQMAADLRMDPGDMERDFSIVTGTTIKRYVDRLKKKKVRDLMTDPQRFGYEIADQLRFQNGEAFYRWVKRVFGVPYRMLRNESNVLISDEAGTKRNSRWKLYRKVK